MKEIMIKIKIFVYIHLFQRKADNVDPTNPTLLEMRYEFIIPPLKTLLSPQWL